MSKGNRSGSRKIRAKRIKEMTGTERSSVSQGRKSCSIQWLRANSRAVSPAQSAELSNPMRPRPMVVAMAW